jgi:hypothetical protein
MEIFECGGVAVAWRNLLKFRTLKMASRFRGNDFVQGRHWVTLMVCVSAGSGEVIPAKAGSHCKVL